MISYIRRADPNQVNPVLYQEISDLKAKYQELERLIDIEQQRRHQVHSLSCAYALNISFIHDICKVTIIYF